MLSGSEEHDTFTLRQVFVNHVTQDNVKSEYSAFFPNLEQMVREFRNPGVFDRDVVDLVIKACANVLKVPIIVVTSRPATSVVPFMPYNALCTRPIYLAYHYYGAGHYDATNEIPTG